MASAPPSHYVLPPIGGDLGGAPEHVLWMGATFEEKGSCTTTKYKNWKKGKYEYSITNILLSPDWCYER